jgi:hypothetical protein
MQLAVIRTIYTFIVDEMGDLWSSGLKWVAVIQSIQYLYPHYFLK